MSIEITVNTKFETSPSKEVFIAWLPTDSFESLLSKCEDVRSKGYRPVPHIVAKKIKDISHANYIANEISSLTSKVLIIGGGGDIEGDFSTVKELVDTKAFDKFEIGVGGFPDGNDTLSYEESMNILKQKTYASFVVTQWSLNIDNIKRFLDDSPLPVYLGVPNDCSIRQLIKFAKMCGIENSVKGILSNPKNILKFALGFKKKSIIDQVKGHKNLKSIHIYTFGKV